MQHSDSEDFLWSASTSPPNPGEDDRNHDPKGTNDLKEVVNKLIPEALEKK